LIKKRRVNLFKLLQILNKRAIPPMAINKKGHERIRLPHPPLVHKIVPAESQNQNFGFNKITISTLW